MVLLDEALFLGRKVVMKDEQSIGRQMQEVCRETGRGY